MATPYGLAMTKAVSALRFATALQSAQGAQSQWSRPMVPGFQTQGIIPRFVCFADFVVKITPCHSAPGRKQAEAGSQASAPPSRRTRAQPLRDSSQSNSAASGSGSLKAGS
jgi:hypothetical protein